MLKESHNRKAFIKLMTMITLTIIIQVIVLIRTSIIASKFGISPEMDGFNFANSIGTFIFSFIGAGVTTVLIPSIIGNKNKQTINNFISTLYLLAFLILIFVYIFKGNIVPMLSDRNIDVINISCNLMFITLITQFLDSFSGATDAIFQCSDGFNIPKITKLISALLLIILIMFIPNLNIYKYAFYIFVSILINTIMNIIILYKNGERYKFYINLKDKEFIDMVRVFLPTVLSTGLYQSSLLLDSIIASNLGNGQISILTYSNTIMSMVNSILLANIITYLYPNIAESIDLESSQERLFDLIILLSAIMCLLVVGFTIVGEKGIELLYQRGEFTSSITTVVYTCTFVYMIALPINAARDVIYRYFYAKGDTLNPFKNSLVISVSNIILSIILSKYIGIIGVILGTVITAYVSLVLIVMKLNKKFGINYKRRIFLREILKIIFTSIIVIIIMKLISKSIIINIAIINILFYGIITLIIYAVLLYFIKSKVFKIKL